MSTSTGFWLQIGPTLPNCLEWKLETSLLQQEPKIKYTFDLFLFSGRIEPPFILVLANQLIWCKEVFISIYSSLQWRWIQIVGKKAATRLKNSSKSSSRIGGAPTSPSFTLMLSELVIVLALLCPSVQLIAFGVSRGCTCMFNECTTILLPVVSVSALTILIRPCARHLFAFPPNGSDCQFY